MHSCFYPAHGPGTSVISWQFNVNSPNQDMDDEIADENVNDEACGVVSAAEVLWAQDPSEWRMRDEE